ncbi:MAG: cache domain-containing protein [Methanocorpusculum sp.]|nr:cache domain-containing protein [Methanocorpusculum sp.]
MNQKLLIPLILCIAACAAAGCVQDTTVYPEILPEMEQILDAYISSIDGIERETVAELSSAAANLSTAPIESEDARTAIRTAYGNLVNVIAILYYEEASGDIMCAPRSSAQFGKELVTVSPGERERVVLHSPVSSPWFGEILSVSVPVYGEDAAVIGRVAAVYRTAELITAAAAEVPELEGYHLAVLAGDGTYIYSPQKYSIGTNYRDNGGKLVCNADKTSGTFYMKSYNVLTHAETPISSIWKKHAVQDSELIFALGTFEDTTDYAGLIDTSAAVENLTAYVEDMYFYSITHSQSDTVKYVNGLAGVSNASVYPAFVMEFDGTVLAMAGHAEYLGRNMNDVDDAYTIQAFKEMEMRAMQGGGFVHLYIDTSLEAVSKKGILSLAYVVPVGRNYFVGAEIPLEPHISEIQTNLTARLNENICTILSFFYKYGREETFAFINDPQNHGSDAVMTAVSYSGVCLADSGHPERVGTDVMGITDTHGDSMTREMLMIAKQGGGYMYFCAKDAKGRTCLYLCCIQPVEESWLVCAAVPVDMNVTLEMSL